MHDIEIDEPICSKDAIRTSRRWPILPGENMNRLLVISSSLICGLMSASLLAANIQAGDKVYTPWLRSHDKFQDMEVVISHTSLDENNFSLSITFQTSQKEIDEKKAAFESMGCSYTPSISTNKLARNLHNDDIAPFLEELEKRNTENAREIADYLRTIK
jgi:hypothetical protein